MCFIFFTLAYAPPVAQRQQ